MSRTRWSRRQFLGASLKGGAGLVLLAGAGYVGYRWPRPSPAGSSSSGAPASEVYSFVSRPDLEPPLVTLTSRPGRGGRAPPVTSSWPPRATRPAAPVSRG